MQYLQVAALYLLPTVRFAADDKAFNLREQRKDQRCGHACTSASGTNMQDSLCSKCENRLSPWRNPDPGASP
jgi:hypothetical protein